MFKPATRKRLMAWVLILTMLVPLIAVAAKAAPTEEGATTQYEITWVVNGIETKETYAEGATPKFNGTPSKAQTVENTYTFTEWQPAIQTVTADATYTAQFKEEARKYTITFKDRSGDIIEELEVPYGTIPDPETPDDEVVSSSSSVITYEFDKWSPKLAPVTGDATYKATYTEDKMTMEELKDKTYTATFKNWDNKTLYSIDIQGGTKPVYDGETPTRPIKNGIRYTFSGWSPELNGIVRNTTYKAQFTRSDADNLVLTAADISKNSKEGMEVDFPCGILYISPNGMKALAEYKTTVSFYVDEDKSGEVEIMVYKGAEKNSKRIIREELAGLQFLATEITSGNVIEIAKGTSRQFITNNFSTVSSAGALTDIPGTCTIRKKTGFSWFSDIGSAAWSYTSVDKMVSRGIIQGFDDGTFRPNSSITREQACVMMHRLDGMPASTGGDAYSDMDPYAWYAKGTFWAISNDLVNGVADDIFGIRKAMSRQDQVYLLYQYARYLGLPCKETTNLARYHDVGYIAKENVDAMEWCVSTGIIQGTSATTLSPASPTTRAQFCVMLERFLDYVAEEQMLLEK